MKQTFLILLTLLFVNNISSAQAKLGAFGELIVENSAPMPQFFGTPGQAATTDNVSNASNTSVSVNTQSGVKHNAQANKKQIKQVKEVKEAVKTIAYNSYKIEIMTVEMPLDLDHHIFSSYEDISFSQKKSIGYTYFSGDFLEQQEAAVMLEKIQRVYPKAIVVTEKKYMQSAQH